MVGMWDDLEEPLVLKFDLKPGERADAAATAEAIIAWVAAVRAANAALDPGSEVVVELVGTEEGSLKLHAILRFIEKVVLGGPADALDPYPKIKKIVVATVLAVPTGLAAGLATWAVLPDATVHLSAADTQAVKYAQKVVQDVPEVQRNVSKFYGAVARNRSVISITISHENTGLPLVTIPMAEFAERSGVWQRQEQADHERDRREVWSVVVTRAAMKAVPLSWRFERDGLPFSAKIVDAEFLRAISAGTLPITVQEGVRMEVVVEWSERLVGQRWEAIDRTRRITNVLSPRPVTPAPDAAPLFRSREYRDTPRYEN